MWDKVIMALGALKDMSSTYANLQDRGGGVGGATSAQTRGGQTGLQYQDVAGTGISPFEFKEVLAQLEDENEQRKMAEAMAQAQQQGLWSGGPVYAASGGDLVKGLLGASILGTGPGTFGDMGRSIVGSIGGIGKNIPPGLIGIFLQKYLDEKEEEEEESIVPLPANMGRPLYANEGLEIEVEDVEGTDPEVEEEFDWENLTEILSEIAGITSMFKESPVSVTARGSVTPLPGGGLGKRQAPYPEPKGSGITPFTYQPAAGGGALGRSMFMQNYMPHGGEMQGPGGPKDDLIPVMASDGEYMLSKAAVDQAGGGNHRKGIARLEQFNRLGNRRYG